MLVTFLYILLGFVLGLVAGIFSVRYFIKRNPEMFMNDAYTESLIVQIMTSSGQKPSQKRINQILRSTKSQQPKKKK